MIFFSEYRYCVALTNNDYVITDVHGKPKFDHNGNYVISRKKNVSLKDVLKLVLFLFKFRIRSNQC